MTVEAYWRRLVRGPFDVLPFSPLAPEHEAQEEALRDVLGSLAFDSVLEVGCGLGRITQMLAGMTDDLSAIDIGPDQVRVTRKRVPTADVMDGRLQDFEGDRRFDLLVAVEVLMHIPPEEIEAACDNLRRQSSGWIVTCDWTEPLPPGQDRAGHNWLHDYKALLGPVERAIPIGRQTIFVIRA